MTTFMWLIDAAIPAGGLVTDECIQHLQMPAEKQR